MDFRILDNALVQELENDPGLKRSMLFIERHPDLKNGFLVNGFDPAWQQKMLKTVGQRKTVMPFNLEAFDEEAKAQGYQVVTMDAEAVQEKLDWLDRLNDVPEVEINSTFPGTIKGFLPFQAQCFNMFKDQDFGWVQHDTGTGKTVTAAGLTKYHQKDYSLALWVVKNHNKTNTARALKNLVDLDSIIIDGTKAKRKILYQNVEDYMDYHPPVLILNYEKFRDDCNELRSLVNQCKNLLVVLDEAPTKIRNRNTKLYKSMCKVLYRSHLNGHPYPRKDATRAEKMNLYVLSATPIENSLLDLYNIVRLGAPDVLPGYDKFKDEHLMIRSIEVPTKWGPRFVEQVYGYRNEDLLGMKIAHVIHQVDKTDPDIAPLFPKVIEEVLSIDLYPGQQKLYDRLMAEYKAMRAEDESALDREELLAAIGCFQMIIDDPRMIVESASRRKAWEAVRDAQKDPEKWEKAHKPEGSKVALKLLDLVGFPALNGAGSAKLDALEELISDSSEKTLIFTTYGQMGLPLISERLDELKIEHVCYHGDLSNKQKQEREDEFKASPSMKVFLSSDSGSDSINLEQADQVIHFNLPWKATTKIQRQNRENRITSTMEHNRFITLRTETEIEIRKQEILDIKLDRHKRVLKGEVAEQSEGIRERQDLMYVLFGGNDED